MRVVVDTSVVVSALLWSGLPHKLLVLAEGGEVALYTSPFLLNELTGVLLRTKFTQRLRTLQVSSEELVVGYATLAHVVRPLPITPIVLSDPADDEVLACAAAAHASYLISGDHHLLNLKRYGSTVIVSPAMFFKTLLPSHQGS